MSIPIEHVDQLSIWLAQSDVDVLELRGPAQHLRLVRRAETVDVQNLTGARSSDEGQMSQHRTVTADSPGIFLHHHPLHATALIQPDARIEKGQMLGLLQIGPLLLPITAPCDGRVEGMWAAHRTAVGFGTPLIELLTSEA